MLLLIHQSNEFIQLEEILEDLVLELSWTQCTKGRLRTGTYSKWLLPTLHLDILVQHKRTFSISPWPNEPRDVLTAKQTNLETPIQCISCLDYMLSSCSFYLKVFSCCRNNLISIREFYPTFVHTVSMSKTHNSYYYNKN